MKAIGIAIPFMRRRSGAAIDAQAQAHFNRVIADGGLIPSGLVGVNAFFKTIKTIYGTADINTAISVGLDPQVLGYKLGAGAGTTLGQAAQKLYSCSGASGDVVQTTAASQPLLLVHEGANYWFGSGVNGNNCTTTTNNNFQVSGDFTIDINISDLTASGEICSKGNSTDGFVLFTNGSYLRYTFFDTNIRTVDLTSDAINWTTNKWVRLKRSGTSYNFWTSSDGVTFTQLGLTITSVIVTKNITGTLRIGQGVSFYSGPACLRYYLAKFWNDATQTTLIADFNPNQYNPSTSQTQWTSSTGEVWTINTGTATTGYKGVLVDRTIVQGDGINDELVSGTLAAIQFFSQYVALNPLSIIPSMGEYYVDGGGAKGLIYGNAAQVRAWNGSEIQFTGTNDNRLNLFNPNYNGASSTAYKNNILNASGNTGSNISDKISLFSNGSGGSFSNAILNSVIKGNTVHTLIQNTAMYNYIRSINNNAF